MTIRRKDHCPKEESCFDATGNYISVCVEGQRAERYYATTPLVPAERLCLRGLEAVSESRPKNTAVDTFGSICYDLDRAIALPHYISDQSETDSIVKNNADVKKNIYMNVSKMLRSTPNLARINNPGEFAIASQMKRIGIFMPAFWKRVVGEPVSQELISQIHSGLVGYIGDLDKLVHKAGNGHHLKKQMSAHKAECEIMALLSRKGELPWPALSREESSHARAKNNHDFYLLRGSSKKAVQVKTSKSGAGYQDVVVIQHYDVLGAMKRQPETVRSQWVPDKEDPEYSWPSPYIYDQMMKGKSADPLVELLTEEMSQGRRMDRGKKLALDLATQYVVTRL